MLEIVKENKKREFRNKVVHSFVTQNIHKGIAIISSIIIARALGPVGKGEYSLIIYVNMIVFAFISIGLSNAQIHLKRKYPLDIITSNVLFLGIVLAILFVIILIPVVYSLRNIVFEGVHLNYIFFALFLLPIQVVSMSLRKTLQSSYKIKTFNLLLLIQPILFLSLLASFSFLIIISVFFTIIAWSISVIANNIITCIVLVVKSTIKLKMPDFAVSKEIIGFAVKYSVGGLIGLFQYRFDIFIVSFLLDIKSVGLYAIGMALAEIVWRIPASIVNVLLPWVAKSKDSDADKFTPKVFRITSIIVLCLGIIIFAFAKWGIILIYGTEFSYSALVVRWILPGVIFISLWKILMNDMNARGYPKYYVYSGLVGFVTMIGLDFILIPRIGLIGAALACSIAYMLTFIIMIIFYLKHTSIKLTFLLPGKSDIILLLRSFS